MRSKNGSAHQGREGKQIRVLLVEPMMTPRVVEIEHSLAAMQELVGGLISVSYPWDDPVAVVVSDEGIFQGYAVNRMIEDFAVLYGPFFICGLYHDDFASLSDDLLQKYSEKFRFPEMFMRTAGGKVINIKIGSGLPPKVL